MALKCISLFTGAGGLDYGFEASGFETAVSLDSDFHACETLRSNREWPVIEADLSQVSTPSILGAAGLRPGEASMLIGGPPCQPFSKSGYWANGDAARLNDPRALTLSSYLQVLEDSLPEAFLLENVPGLAFSGKSDGLNHIQDEVAAINHRQRTNYRLSIACLNAANYGVPQIRQRVFIIAHRDGKLFRFPNATHAAAGENERGLEPFRTAWDALGDLPEVNSDPELRVTGKWAELLPSVPEGQNYLWHTQRGGGLPLFGWRTRYWNFLLKLSPVRPAWTIQAHPGPATGPFHWTNRKLSIRELLRLQTFPDDISISCDRASAQRLIGNAVPSALAEILSREIRAQFFHAADESPASGLLPPRRVPTLDGWPVAPVAPRYRRLIGDHPDHPGIGKGARASFRGGRQLVGVKV
jgi:DNA (cytosine-5)-methyltransferase 1